MKNVFESYECDGQISMFEYLKELDQVYPLEIKGLCDDAYCSKCGYAFDELKELDCERCPKCGVKVDWQPWHNANDQEV